MLEEDAWAAQNEDQIDALLQELRLKIAIGIQNWQKTTSDHVSWRLHLKMERWDVSLNPEYVGK